MKKKLSNPMGPKCTRLDSSSNKCAVELGTLLGSRAPPNSETVPESTSKVRHFTMSQHSQNLLKFLNEDRTRHQFCDVSVRVGGKLYSAHKVVLAHGSSYFHAELSKNPATTQVTLDHVEDSVFQLLLGFLYTSKCVISETALPALTEAARFLDMMDILKLLCEGGGDSNPVHAVQVRDEVEMIASDSPAGDTDNQSPSDSQCSLDNHQFSTITSLQNHMNESHTDVQQETSTHKEKTTPTTRRSTRRRRTPTKYQRNSVEYPFHTPEEEQRTVPHRTNDEETANKAGQVVVENLVSKLNETPMLPQEADAVDEEEEEGGVNEDINVQRKAVEVCMADKHAGQQCSDVEGAEQQSVREVEVDVPAVGSSTQSPVYPEGLAPVIIQTSSKKTLKCPKCDKTFDRAGRNRKGRSLLY